MLQPIERARLPAIVESHPVDDRAVLGEPEQPRLRIALLRARRDRSDLDESEAEAEHLLGDFRVFVEPGGETDGRWEFQASEGRSQRGREDGRSALWRKLERGDRCRCAVSAPSSNTNGRMNG